MGRLTQRADILFVPFTAYALIGPGNTVYMTHGTMGAGIAPRFLIVTKAGVLRDLHARSHANPGGAETYIFTVMVNGGAVALTCTLLAGNTGSDLVNRIPVVPGDIVIIRAVASGGANAVYIGASIELWRG